MSVARITTLNLKSKEGADEIVQSYTTTAPNKFPEAEQLIQIRSGDTTIIALYFVVYIILAIGVPWVYVDKFE